MEPTTPDVNMTVIAGLIALAVGLIRVVEKLIDWAARKVTKTPAAGTTVVHLDPEVSKMIGETGVNVRDMHGIMSRVDRDGTPMVYSSRTASENLKDIAMIIQDVSKSQERLAATLSRHEDRFEDHDRFDRMTLERIEDSLERIDKKK